MTSALCFPFAPSLHGSPLTDAGLALLNPALALHPALVALDLGDCMLGDEAINLICGLLPPDGAKSGEQGQPAECTGAGVALMHAQPQPMWEGKARTSPGPGGGSSGPGAGPVERPGMDTQPWGAVTAAGRHPAQRLGRRERDRRWSPPSHAHYPLDDAQA